VPLQQMERKILFRKKALIRDNKVVRITANITKSYINMLFSKYLMKVGKIKNLMWRQFVDRAYTKGDLNFY